MGGLAFVLSCAVESVSKAAGHRTAYSRTKARGSKQDCNPRGARTLVLAKDADEGTRRLSECQALLPPSGGEGWRCAVKPTQGWRWGQSGMDHAKEPGYL